MDQQKKLKLLGILALLLGGLAAIVCLVPKGIIIALPLGFFGMIFSSMYVYIDTKEQINTNSITPGIIGIVLSSIPVVLILAFTVIHHFKNG